MSPGSVPDTRAVNEALARAAVPALARSSLARIIDAEPKLADEIAPGGQLLDALVALACASQSIVGAAVADPTLLDTLRAHDLDVGLEAQSAIEAAIALDLGDIDVPLRRFKRRHLVRIAARDLLGLADLRVVGAELASLAQACIEASLRAARSTIGADVTMTVIGMGKLGGGELNYASDVDVVFVHEGDAEQADRVARSLLRTMSVPGPDGIVFRTDADLRPEGRDGPLSRTLDAFAAYWDRWAEAWEMQALIKARPVAGDAELGEAFTDAAEPQIWPTEMHRDRIRSLRLLKARGEQVLDDRGLTDREVKRGWGGIRDVEFTVQLLQLVHGRRDSSVRAANTLTAVEQLALAGYLGLDDAGALDRAYVWHRTVEHRLQLWQEQQTHTLPTSDEARDRLARVLGFRGSAEQSATSAFEAAHRSQQAITRGLYERLYFAPILDALDGTGTLTLDAATERLDALGFHDVSQTRDALDELTAGLTRRSRLLADLLPTILDWVADGADPDLGLLQLRRIAEGYTRSEAVARLFRDTPFGAQRLCRVLGSSRVLGMALHRQPEAIADFADDARLETTPSANELVAEAVDTLNWREGDVGRAAGLRRFKRRELLRIGTRDLTGFATLDVVGEELSNLADAALEAALRSLEPSVPFAVIGMGRLGGRELTYPSDIDVLFVYDGSGASSFDEAERTATRLMRAIGATTADGQTWHIDADLRPEGRKGVLARSIEGYREYYERWAEPWEFQALLRARHVAGDPGLVARFLALVEPLVYRSDFSETDARNVRRMKARIEKERIPGGVDPRLHLKLGPGSLSDVEFTVQLLQLRHGAVLPSVRAAATRGALDALVAADLLAADDATTLRDAYDLAERVRNYTYLHTGSPGDVLPIDALARRVGRMLGYTTTPATTLEDEYRRATRRARDVVERVFYDRP